MDPVEANTKNVALERDYHLSRVVKNAEHTIGTFEDRFAELVRRLRTGNDSNVPGELDRFFLHIFLRSTVCRQFLLRLGDEIKEVLTAVIDEIPLAPTRSPDLRRAIFDSITEAVSMLQCGRSSQDVNVYCTTILKGELLKHSRNQAMQSARAAIAGYDIVGQIRDAHVRTIIEELHGSISQRTPFTWRTEISDGPLCLGDIGPLAFGEEGDVLEPVLFGIPAVRSVILAIDSTRFLLGHRGKLPVAPSAQEWNLASAIYSQRFFIADRYNTDFTALSTRIGDSFHLPTFDEVISSNPELAREFRHTLQQEIHNPTSPERAKLYRRPTER